MDKVLIKVLDMDNKWNEIYEFEVYKDELENILEYKYIPIKDNRNKVIPYTIESVTYNLEAGVIAILAKRYKKVQTM